MSSTCSEEAGPRQPRPQVLPIPEIEGDLRHLVTSRRFPSGARRQIHSRSPRHTTGVRFEMASLGPQIIGRMVAESAPFPPDDRQATKTPPMPDAVRVSEVRDRTSAVRSPLSLRSRPPNTLKPVMSLGSPPPPSPDVEGQERRQRRRPSGSGPDWRYLFVPRRHPRRVGVHRQNFFAVHGSCRARDWPGPG